MAIARRNSRRIVVDNVIYRWTVRRSPTHNRGLAAPISFVVELLDEPAGRLLVSLPVARPDNWRGTASAVVTQALVARQIADAGAAGWEPARRGRVFQEREHKSLDHQVSAVSIIRDAQGGGDLWGTIGIAAPGEKSRQITACQQPPRPKPGYAVPQCERRDRPDSAIVAVRSLKESAPSSSGNSVTVVRGNTSIWIASTNSDRISRTDSGAPARTRPTPALTVDQLLELALSPDLTLYP